jgi:AcrR family transcriptional regulator
MTAQARAPRVGRTLKQRSDAAIDALLQVARESFGGKGYAATSLDDVAALAGMTKGAVYHHFGSKHALFEGVFRLEHRRTIDTVVAKSRGARDPIDGLLRGVRAYLQYVLDPVAQRILLEDGPSVLGWERWRRCEEPGFQQLLEISLTRAAERGMLRRGVRPAETALLLLGAMTEGALAVAHAEDPVATARRLSDALATHVRALCSPAA